MGSIIGGIGSAVGGGKAASAARDQAQAQLQAAQIAAQTARLGFDWLTSGPGGDVLAPYLSGGRDSTAAINALLGLGGDQKAAEQAFRNYQGSTGYDFRLGQGMQAITGSNAAKGLLDSGATLRGLTQYGQNLGSAEFGNYLSQLFNVGTRGIDAAKTIGAAGSQAGQVGAGNIMQGQANASNLIMQGIGAQNAGFGNLFNGIGNSFNQMNGGQGGNPFSGIFG
jgi:hypothetical protein